MADFLQVWRTHFFKLIEAAIFVLVVSLIGLIGLQVFTRYVMHAAVPWTEEVARMLLVWTVMLGSAVAMERKQHYVIAFLLDQLKGKPKVALIVAANCLGLIFLFTLSAYGVEYVRINVGTEFVSTGVHRSWVYLALPVGAIAMAISLLTHSIEALIQK